MDGYIPKPINPQRLYETLDELVAAEPESDVFDLSETLRRVPGGREAVSELAQLLLAECPKMMQSIRSGVERKDIESVQRGAHTLRGSADVFGAKNVVAAAQRLETMGREGDLKDADAALADLEREVDRLQAAMRSVVAGIEPEARS
jgi:HPt (histidine-containing phosphotransfer) domain-containing protein